MKFFPFIFLCSFIVLFSCVKQKQSDNNSNNKGYIKIIKKCNPEIVESYLPLLNYHLHQTAGKLQKSKTGELKPITPENKKTLARRLINEVLKTIRRSKRNKRLEFLMASKYRPLRKCFKMSTCQNFASCFTKVTELANLNQIKTSDIIKINPVKHPTANTASAPGKHKSPLFSTTSKKIDLAVYNSKIDLRTTLKGSSPYLFLKKNKTISILEKSSPDTMKTIQTVDLSSYGGEIALLKGKKGEIIIKTRHALLLLDQKFRTLPVWKPKKGEIIGSAYLHKNHILLGTGRDFVILNSKFRKIARVDLNIHKRGKEVHDIIVNKNQALLLDNRRVPVLIFRVDISNPSQPKIIERINEDGIYAHLHHQWVDVRQKKWGIFMNTHGRCGTTQHLLLLKLKPDPQKAALNKIQSKMGTKRDFPPSLNRQFGKKNSHLLAKNIFYQYLAKRCLQFVDKNNKTLSKKDKYGNLISGYKFVSGSRTSPFWSLFKRMDTFYLGKVKIEGKKAKATDLIKLDLIKCTGWFRKRGGKQRCNSWSYPDKAVFTSDKTNLVIFAEKSIYWYKTQNPGKLSRKLKTEIYSADSIVLYP